MKTWIPRLLQILALIAAVAGAPAYAQLNASWTQMFPSSVPAGGPSARGWIDTFYDTVSREHVLFGGSGLFYFNDVWTYSLSNNHWIEREPNIHPINAVSPPCRRDEHSTEFDARNRLYFSFGGTGFSCGLTSGTAAAGTTTTSLVDPALPATTDDFYLGWLVEVPGPNVGRAWVVAYNAAEKRLTLEVPIGHLTAGRAYSLVAQSNGGLWSYNPATREWRGYDSPIWGYTGPKPRTRFAPAFTASPADNAIVMFGGGEFNDTWVFDTETLSWVQMKPDGAPGSPPRRVEITNSMAYDSVNQVFILFGGECREVSGTCTYGTLLSDTWAYRLATNTWTNMSPPQSPSLRSQQQMAFDPVNQVVVLYGGHLGSTVFDDIWVYSYTANTWTQVPTTGSTPGGRYLGAMSYDPELNRFMQFGGIVGGSSTNAVWALQLNNLGNNQSPQVAITAPGDGATFGAPANIAFSVNASDPDGTVSRVQYFSGGTMIFESTVPPYAFTWSNVPVGNYVVTAKAIDNFNAETISAPVNIVVSASGSSYQVSGAVTTGGSPLAGVNLAATGNATCLPTDSSGQYSCTVPQGYTGTITPALSGYTFVPASRSYSNISGNQTAQDYTATINLDTIWVEDAIPAGAVVGGNEPWNWVSNSPTPFSGSVAHRSDIFEGMHQHHFNNATATLSVGVGDTLFAYVYLDPANVPSQVMLQWNDGTWEHRAYWGGNLINWGVDDTVSRRYMGPLPPAGQWVRLEVPAALVGLENRVVRGMAFTLYNGRATWDRAGKSSNTPLTNFTIGGTVTASGSPLAGVNFSATNGATCTPSNAAGQYSCTVPQGYSGTVTPSLGGHTFSPASRSYVNVAANQTAQDYSATAVLPSPIISGTVTSGGAPLSGVTFSAGAGTNCNASNAVGQYTCTVPQGFTGAVTPTLAGHTFAPPSRSYSSVTSDQNAQDYIATIVPPVTFAVSGTVLAGGAPLAGVSFAGGAGTNCNASNAAGEYACTVPQGYTGSITPSLFGYSFTPSARNYSNVTSDQNGEDYSAVVNQEVVWVEDAIPAGGTLGGTEPWNWVSSNPAPFSGSLAHRSEIAAGMHQHHFNNATATLNVGVGDTLFAYVYLDPANVPSQVMLQWNDGTWEHRAYWGGNLINWGVDDTVSRRNMGPLPPAGQWVRLEVPAALVGLENRVVRGMAFTLYNGRATWDRAGKSSAPTTPAYVISGTVLASGSPLSGVSPAGSGGATCNNSNAAGQYSCTVPQGYTGTITPALSGYTFEPPSRSYSSVTSDQNAQDYVATIVPPLTFAVSGTVLAGGAPLAGVSFAGGAGTNCNASNAAGEYSCTVPQGYTGSITPSLFGYSFTPSARNYSNVTSDQNGEDYSAVVNQEVVWVEDAIPAGGTLGGTEPWNWVSSNPAPFSGSLAHRSEIAAGMHQHHFNNATATLSVNVGDTLFAYVYLDPANLPSQVMLQWNDGTWDHRAYWGTNLIGWGTEGTASLRNMGPLPPAGQWVRLEVPAALVGLENRVVRGMAFTLYNGRATWDRAGKR